MKKINRAFRFLILIGFMCSSSQADEFNSFIPSVDYLQLTRSTLPSAHDVVAAAYANLDFNLTNFKDRVARVYRASLLPESVNLSYGYAPDALAQYGFYDRSTYATRNGTFNNSSDQTQHGALPNQFDTRETLSLSLRWDLQKLFGFDSEELNTLASMINQVDQEGFALNQIARSYGQLIAALPEDDSESVNESKALIIIEHAAIIDSLSGGLLTRVISTSSDINIILVDHRSDNENKSVVKSNAEINGMESIIEVRDGQDDGIEVVGGASN